jgi:hypothetical protein
MTARIEPRLCTVCSARLPPMTRAKALQKGAATVIGDQTYYHCAGNRHTEQEIKQMIAAVPRFGMAGKAGA